VNTGSATTKDWLAATKNMTISAHVPGGTVQTGHDPQEPAPRSRDERIKIAADPEEALTALLRKRREKKQ
jgi:hypothetical protein